MSITLQHDILPERNSMSEDCKKKKIKSVWDNGCTSHDTVDGIDIYVLAVMAEEMKVKKSRIVSVLLRTSEVYMARRKKLISEGCFIGHDGE